MSVGVTLELDGASVFVGRGGASWQGGKRSRVVLMHGAGMDHTVWVLLGRWLARHGHDVVVPDLPGHGQSGGEPLQSIEAMSDWLARLLSSLQQHALSEVQGGASLGDGPLTVIGHSMGALIALEATGRIPVSRLVLLGVGYPMAVGAPLLKAAESDLSTAADLITHFGHAYSSRLGHNPLPGIPVANLARILLMNSRPGALHKDLSACAAYCGAEAFANSDALSDTDVQIVAGDQDKMTPPKASLALATLLSASVHWLPGSGHMMMSEYPEETLAAVRASLVDA